MSACCVVTVVILTPAVELVFSCSGRSVILRPYTVTRYIATLAVLTTAAGLVFHFSYCSWILRPCTVARGSGSNRPCSYRQPSRRRWYTHLYSSPTCSSSSCPRSLCLSSVCSPCFCPRRFCPHRFCSSGFCSCEGSSSCCRAGIL
jgi:hypothetical protein